MTTNVNCSLVIILFIHTHIGTEPKI